MLTRLLHWLRTAASPKPENLVAAASHDKLFVPPGHFYSPVVNREEAERHLDKLQQVPSPLRLAGIDPDLRAMTSLWAHLLPYLTSNPFGDQPLPGWRYGFDNPAYAWADGSILHAMLRHYRPRRYLEVGCGWSSACAIDTIEHFLDASCDVTLIEPYFDLAASLIGQPRVPLTVHRARVQDVPLETFDALQANDILFIDSTHVLRTGNDLCFELFEVLPRLAPGVIVHFHDVFWPFEYGREWVIDENRSWNELYALRAYLMNNSDWRILFFNDYFYRHENALIATQYPTFMRNSGGALWLQRT